MKKLMVMIVAVGFLVSGTASSVELEPDCAAVFDSAVGFDMQFMTMAALLNSLEPSLPDTVDLFDLESVTGPMSGDGIPDTYQLGMLGAVMCDPSGAAIVAQFENNKVEFLGLIDDLSAVIVAGGPVATDMQTVGQDIVDWATAIPSPSGSPDLDALRAQALALGGGLITAGEETATFLTTYGGIITTALPLYKEWFAGMGGLNSEMQITLDALLGDLLSGLTDFTAEFQGAADGLVALAAAGTTLVPPPYTMTTELATAMTDLAASINAMIPLLTAITLPQFEVYGAAKAANEPFSAAGDYNGDGLTNGETYTYVTGAGGDRPVFVSAATGTNPFWPGNPGLPVAGLFGLAALAGLVASAGAMIVRKK